MNQPSKTLDTWRRFHWMFFVQTQGIIITLERFRRCLESHEIANARLELTTAADLLRASAAAMELAGDYTPNDYANEVRPSMMPPSVKSNNFSGMMSWDHTALIQLWQDMHSLFRKLPDELTDTHKDFVNAYRSVATAHRAVCQRFGGAESGSLRNTEDAATAVLDRFQKSRTNLIAPKGVRGCPAHP